MNSRIVWLDVMKGTAIILVVLGHALNNLGLFNHPVNVWLHYFHMPFFFLLSGFLAVKSLNKGFAINIKNKSVTLLLPFISCGLIYSLSVDDLKNYIWGIHHAGYWFLISLWSCWIIFYSIIYLFIKTRYRNNIILEMFILITPFFLGNILMENLPEKINNALSFPLTFSQYRFFIMGYFMGKFYFDKSLLTKIKAFIPMKYVFDFSFIIFTLTSLFILIGKDIIQMCPITVWQIILCISLFIVLFYSEKYLPSRTISNLCNLGVNSLSIYVFHVYFVYQFGINEIDRFTPGIQTLIASFTTVLVIYLTLFVSKPISTSPLLSYIFLGKKLR